MPPKLYGERINKVVNWMVERGERPLAIKQLLRSFYKSNLHEFQTMKELRTDLRTSLVETFGSSLLSLQPVSDKIGGQAAKVLLECYDKQKIEAVSLSFRNHKSICISSQVGCAFGCTFCESGKVGLKRQLLSSEITDQVSFFQSQEKLGSISFMGMGEPLSNPKVFDAISALTNPEQFGLSTSRINVSTIGIIPGLSKLNQVHPDVNLAYSLHCPFPDQRLELMPIQKAYPFSQVFDLLDERIKRTNNRVWIAYLLLQGVNDSLDHARALVNIIRSRTSELRYLYHINLLPYNAGRTPQGLQRVSDISAFRKVIEGAGISTSYRNSFGRTIDAACGQLYAEYESRSIRPTGIHSKSS
jgi:23S rRNA (adenine-C8)-methyltransferase